MAIHRFQSVAVEHAVDGLAFDGIRHLSAVQEFRQFANRGIEQFLECDARFCRITNLRSVTPMRIANLSARNGPTPAALSGAAAFGCTLHQA